MHWQGPTGTQVEIIKGTGLADSIDKLIDKEEEKELTNSKEIRRQYVC